MLLTVIRWRANIILKFCVGDVMAKQLRIATFNLENLDDDDQTTFEVRKKVLQPMLTRMNADVLFLQEINSIDALDNLIEGTIYETGNFDKSITKTNSGNPYSKRNLVTLSRYNIVSTLQYRNDKVPYPKWQKVTSIPPETDPKSIWWERPVLHSIIELSGDKKLHAINLHLKSKNPTKVKGQVDDQKYYLWYSHEGWAEGYFLSAIKRLGQALEVRKVIGELLNSDPLGTLIAIGGDFNAEIGSVPFKTIVGSITDTNNPELRSTLMIPCELNVPSDRRYSHLYYGEKTMLDHVMVSHCLFPYWEGTEIYNELLPDESVAYATDIKFPESDHAPVIATFNLPDTWLP